jgi:uncharacterized protein
LPRFAMICIDKPDHTELRAATRDDHLAYIAETGVVEQAGPLMNEAGEMTGSLLILDVPDRDAALRWGGSDPYFLAGLFESVSLHRWKKVIG